MSGTRITYLHGVQRIAANDTAGRGSQLRSQLYIPFTQLSKGQFDLMVQRNLARTYADYSGDPVYTQAENMLSRALKGDSAITGSIPQALYGVAATIKQARSNVFAVSGIKGPTEQKACRESAVKEMLRLYSTRVKARYGLKYASRYNTLIASNDYEGFWNDIRDDKSIDSQSAASSLYTYLLVGDYGGLLLPNGNDFYRKCVETKEVEALYNSSLKDCAHHTLYNVLDPRWTSIPPRLDVKRNDHLKAVLALAQAGGLDEGSFKSWINSLVITKNIEKANQALTPIETAFVFDKTESYYESYLAQIPTKGVKGIGKKFDQSTIDFIIAIASGAATVAGIIYASVQKFKGLDALKQVSNYPTAPFGPNQTDFLGGNNSNGGSGLDQNTLLIIGAAAAGYLLLSDK